MLGIVVRLIEVYSILLPMCFVIGLLFGYIFEGDNDGTEGNAETMSVLW